MHVVVNAAMSVDGKLATRCREQLYISGPADRDRVDELRSSVDAVLVGIGTVFADDPGLVIDDPDRRAARVAAGQSRQPIRVVVDSRGRTPIDAQVLDDRTQTIVLVADAAVDAVNNIESTGADVLRAGDDSVDLAAGLAALEARGVESLLVEGGGEIIFSFFESDLVDELSVYVGSLLIGGRDAPTLADGRGFVDELSRLSLRGIDRIDDGVLLRYDVDD